MNKRGVVLYLHVHQPLRIRDYSIFDTAKQHDYFAESGDNDRNNERVFRKVAEKSYRPMNALLEKLLKRHPEFKISFSITGTFIEQAEKWAPDVLESFKRLAATGQVDIVSETYYHSLAFFYSREEFERQVAMHQQKITALFGITPTVFRNTELSYNNELASWAEQYGFKGIMAEGWDPILEWRSPNHMYKPINTKTIRLMLKNYRLSDDIAFRFGNKSWEQWPLHAETYNEWMHDAMKDSELVNLFMDYETFGEHQWHDTGIFEFFETFVGKWLEGPGNTFYTTAEAVAAREPVAEISMPQTVTWADTERDLTAWLGNAMQQEALHHLYALEEDIVRTGNQPLIDDWRKLQTSDHVYYMCTKWFNDGDVHAYFSPYESPYDAFLSFMNVLRDIRFRLYEYHQHGGFHG